MNTEQHHVIKEWYEGPHGRRTPAVERFIHKTRTCQNCAHNGLKDPEWPAEDWGFCQNLVFAPDADLAQMVCSIHQTPREFKAGILCIVMPVNFMEKTL